MIEQQGRVIRLTERGVRVSVGPRTGCSACDAGRGCGAGLFGKLLRRRPIELDLPLAEGLAEGQGVRIGISEAVFLRLVMQMYGWPLLAGLVGGWVCLHIGRTYGANRGLGDLLTLGGMVTGAGISLRYRRRTSATAGNGVRMLGPVEDPACVASAVPAARNTDCEN